MSEQAKCGLCGEPMPPGEEMFNYHGASGPCPKPAAPPSVQASKVSAEEQAAIDKLFDAWRDLRRLGWRDAIYCPKDGSSFWSIEPGSTGVHDTHYAGEWPNGCWWVAEANDIWPSRPCLFKAKQP